MKRITSTLIPALKESMLVIGAYVLIGIAFTIVPLLYSASSVRIGTLRPIGTIPPHEFILLLGALTIFALSSLVYRKFDFAFLLLPVIFVILLDFDHLPSFFGIPQPIRPAHSLFFLLALLLILRFGLKRQLYVELFATSSFFMHIAIDNGVFPLLSPFSFKYYSVGDVRLYLIMIALALAVFAGYSRRHSLGKRHGKADTSIFQDGKPVMGEQRQSYGSSTRKLPKTASNPSVSTYMCYRGG